MLCELNRRTGPFSNRNPALSSRYAQQAVARRQGGWCGLRRRRSQEPVQRRHHQLGPDRQPGGLRGGGVSAPGEEEGPGEQRGAGGPGDLHLPADRPEGLAGEKQLLGEFLTNGRVTGRSRLVWLHNCRCATKACVSIEDPELMCCNSSLQDGFVQFFRVSNPEATVRNTLLGLAGFAGIGALALLIRWFGHTWTFVSYKAPSLFKNVMVGLKKMEISSWLELQSTHQWLLLSSPPSLDSLHPHHQNKFTFTVGLE